MSTTSSTDISTTSTVGDRARILIVDDHPMFRIAIREVLARRPELEVVGEAGSVAEAIACVDHHLFDVVIVDLVLPDGRGVAFVDHVLNAQPDCKVLALSGVDEPIQIAEMLRAGASGYALKSQPVGEIIEALGCVLRGGRSVPAASRAHIDKLLDSPDPWPLERLTPREREVFGLIADGYANKDVATKLSIATRTVETHRHRIMHKLAARSLADLFQIAMRHGFVPHQRQHP